MPPAYAWIFESVLLYTTIPFAADNALRWVVVNVGNVTAPVVPVTVTEVPLIAVPVTAAGVAPPITAASIVPPSMSGVLMSGDVNSNDSSIT